MSCSQLIEQKKDESDTFVIIVNGNGTVTVNSNILEHALRNKFPDEQCKAAVSIMRKLENMGDEPDSQTVALSEENEKSAIEEDLVVEDYLLLPPPGSNSENISSDSVVSSTVETPPLPQSSSELFDILAEGLDIAMPQSSMQTSLEGCIPDSLIHAFTEMAPEQLEQVETALHSEKAKQILGDDASSVLDKLTMVGDDADEWTQFDHCYTVNCTEDGIEELIEDSQAEEIIIGWSDELSNLDASEPEPPDFPDLNDAEYKDDPEKLWCICKKPHNNRFMICCDACDNWFHGNCVGVTQAMGGKMEQDGSEWLCPSCRKAKLVTECDSQPKKRLSDLTSGDSPSSNVSICSKSTTEVPSPLQRSPATKQSSADAAVNRRVFSPSPSKVSTPTQLCSVCKENEAMPEGLYCGNACIVRYVVASVEKMNKSYEEPLPEDQKIVVVDRKKQHMVTGMRGPSISELPRYIADHPSFEIVKPSAFPIRPGRELKIVSKPVTIEPLKPIFVNTKNSHTSTSVTIKPKPAATVKRSIILDGIETSPNPSKRYSDEKRINAADNVFVKERNRMKAEFLAKIKDKDRERQRTTKVIPAPSVHKPVGMTRPNPASVTSKSSSTLRPPQLTSLTRKPTVPTSPSVQKTALKRKSEPPKIGTTGDVVAFKRKDVKKAPNDSIPSEAPVQRSNMNERERIRRSCRQALDELFNSRMKDVSDINVRKDELTALANQVEDELFNLFNDTNVKYKSKYRSLRFNIKDQKNTLFRRIAERSLTPHDLVRLSAEELAPAELAQWREREAKHEIDMIKKTELENLNQPKILVLKTHKGELEIESQALPTTSDVVVPDLQPDEVSVRTDKSKKSSTLKLKTNMKEKDVAKKDDKDRHKRHDHREKHESSSSSHKHRHRSAERERHRHRSRSRGRSKDRADRDSRKSTEKKDHSKSSSDKKHDGKSSSHKDRHSRRHRSRSRSRRRKERSPAKRTTETPKHKPPSAAATQVMANAGNDEKISTKIDAHLSDAEPSSTVTIQTPQLPSIVWKGTLVMPDVIKLQVRMSNVSGRCEGLDADLPDTLDCVGRIHPQTVWDYLSKMRKSSSREILVLRFEAEDDEQRANYDTLYSYLNQKNRAAVIGCRSPLMKDFYVIPLASHSPIPRALLPLDGPGLEDSRLHVLLGVVVCSRRQHLPMTSSFEKQDQKSFVRPSVSYATETRTAPPTASLVKPPSTARPRSAPSKDGQEGDSSLQLQRELEVLNRRINEQKQQIECISSSLPQEEVPKFYCPAKQLRGEPEKSNVQLPGELQQLLNNLNRRTDLFVENKEDEPDRKHEESVKASVKSPVSPVQLHDSDLRLKMLPSVDPFHLLATPQPPSSDTESGSDPGSGASTSTSTPVPITPYMYGTSSFIPGFPPSNEVPALAPLYMPSSSMFTPATALPFAPVYIPPTSVLPTDPSTILSVVESNEMRNALKRKSLEDDTDESETRDWRSSGCKRRTQDQNCEPSPARDGYDSQRRGYQRSGDEDLRAVCPSMYLDYNPDKRSSSRERGSRNGKENWNEEKREV